MIVIQFQHLVAFSVALIIAFFSTPIARRIALRSGAVDIPKDGRRMHNKPMALMGGLAIIIGFALAVFFGFASRDFAKFMESLARPKILGLMSGVLIIIALGIIDDIRTLRARIKFPFHVLAAVIAVATGTRITSITKPFQGIGMPYILGETLAFLFSVLWIAGITNAINLIDGLDGLAAGVSGIAALSLFIVAVIRGEDAIALISVSLVGAIFGFLPFNFNPAKIFMGDTGATFLGFILAALSIEGTMKSVTALALAIPILVLGLPIFDTFFAILRRISNGKPIGQGDRGHLHHRLLDMGLSHRMSVIILYVISGALGLFSITLVDKGLLPSLILLIVIVIFVIGGARNMSEINRPAPGGKAAKNPDVAGDSREENADIREASVKAGIEAAPGETCDEEKISE